MTCGADPDSGAGITGHASFRNCNERQSREAISGIHFDSSRGALSFYFMDPGSGAGMTDDIDPL